MNIEAGKFYKTRDGRKARIYSVGNSTLKCEEVEYAQNIHGAIEFIGLTGKTWLLCAWDASGMCAGGRERPSMPNYDLVAPWDAPPLVDWDNFPSHIVAVAMNEDGDWHGFSDIPAANSRDKAWYSSVSGHHGLYNTFGLYDDHCPDFSGDWRDSLAIRPGHEPYTQPFLPYNSNEPTPGPWRIGNGSCVVADGLTGHDDPRTVESYGGHLVCESATTGNLHLIKAAWEMYEACKEAMAFIRHYAPEEESVSGRLHRAVCSAEGIPF